MSAADVPVWVFAIAAAALLGLAVAAIVVPLLRRSGVVPVDREEALAVYRLRIDELTDDHARGALDDLAHAQALREVEAELARELTEREGAVPVATNRRPVAIAVAAAVLVPVVALAIYLRTGAPEAAAAAQMQASADAKQRTAMRQVTARLEQRLRDQPADVDGLWLLGRSWLELSEPGKAIDPLARASILRGDDADLALDYAEALAGAAGGRLTGAPATLITKAIALQPDNRRGLWLAAMAASEHGDNATAVDRLTALTKLLEPGSRDLAMVEARIAALRAAPSAGATESPVPAPVPAPIAAAGDTAESVQPETVPPKPADAAGAARISVRVELDPALASDTRPDDTVFVFARATSGPPMPLAVARTQVRNLPVTLVLDDSMAMMPQMRLSLFPEVTVGARVSRSGTPLPQSGDVQGFADRPVTTATAGSDEVRVVMRERLP